MSIPTVLIVSQDQAVEQYLTALRAKGLSCEIAASPAEVQRFIGRLAAVSEREEAAGCVAIVDCDLPQDTVNSVFALFRGARPTPPDHRLVSDPHPARRSWPRQQRG